MAKLSLAPASDLPEQMPALPEALAFLQVLWAVNHGIEQTSRHMEETLGVTAQQRMIIRVIGHSGEIFAGQLADVLQVDPGTISAALKRLEARGFIKRKADSKDKRRVRLTLSPKGKSVDVPVDQSVEAAVLRTLSRIPKAKLKGAIEALTTLTKELDLR